MPAEAQSTTAKAIPARLVLILGAMVALGPLTIDLYLPALPTLTTEFGAPASAVQLTLTGTLAGLAAGQLLIGPWADTIGRRIPLAIGVASHAVSSLLIVVAPSVAVFGALRVLQGLGAAAAVVVATAIVRDLFTGQPAAILMSQLMLVMGAAPILAPVLGGQLLRVAGWQAVFLFLAMYGGALLVVVRSGLPETLPIRYRRSFRARAVLSGYWTLLHDRAFVGLTVVAGLAMASMFAYVAGASFILQEEFGLDPQQFGLMFGAGGLALIAATQVNAALLRWFKPRTLLLCSSVTGVLAGLVLLSLAATATGGVLGVVFPMWVVLGSVGVALANAPVLALARHGGQAGSAAALLGVAQFGAGALISPIVGGTGGDALAMAVAVAVAQVLALVALLTVVWPPSPVDQ